MSGDTGAPTSSLRISALREHGAGMLVAAISSAFGTALILASDTLATVVGHSQFAAALVVRVALSSVAIVFFVIAVYVGAIVTTNTFSTIVAGRLRMLALLRLLGASSRTLRSRIAREGLVVGGMGAVIGTGLGVGLCALAVRLLVMAGTLPDLVYPWISPTIIAPALIIVLVTWLAAWIGARRVLTVSPIAGTGASVETAPEAVTRRRARHVIALALFVLGISILVLGMLEGAVSALGVLVGVVGGVVSFTGLILAGPFVMPPLLRVTGRALGTSAPARLAAQNAVRAPERSARTTIALTIGVTLLTMFSVALASFRQAVLAEVGAADQSDVLSVLNGVFAVFSGLIGVAAVIAAIGMVSSLSLSVLQRRRELGLLRALGFTRAQIRWMIVAESAAITATGVVAGLILGILYGWAGAQSLVGSTQPSHLVVPVVPIGELIVVVAAGAALAIIAALAPSGRAARIAPITALAVE